MSQILTFLALVVSALADHECQSDTSCIAACEQVGNVMAGCVRSSSCDLTYHHCTCVGAAALRTDGGCEAAIVKETSTSANRCASATYDVLFTAAARATPDLKPEDFSTGELPRGSALATVLLSSLQAALKRPLSDVLVSNTHLKLHSKNQASLVGKVSSAPTLLFDIGFSFCLAGNASVEGFSLEELRSRAFEFRFGEEAQRYAAFHPSTIRVLSLVRAATSTSDAPVQMLRSTVSSAPASAEEDILFVSPSIFWVAVASMGAALCTCYMKAISLVLERRRNSVMHKSADANPVETHDAGLKRQQEAVALACVTESFDPTEAAQADTRFESCLSLEAGDVVEVHASSGLWLYGCVHGIPEPMGHFPEGIVAWIGQSLSCSLEGGIQGVVPTDQHGQGAWISQAFACPLPAEFEEGSVMEQVHSFPGSVAEP